MIAMEKFFDFLDRRVAGPMSMVSEQRHIRAIRDGVISAIPFIIAGSFVLIIAAPPVPETTGLAIWAKAHIDQILVPYRMTFGLMSVYVCFGVGSSLARSYDLDGLAGGQLGVAAFLLSLTPKAIGDGVFLDLESLGSQGLFPAMILALLAVEVMRVCYKHNLTIRMPEQVPESVSKSFGAVVPAFTIMVVMALVSVVLGIDIIDIVRVGLAPLVTAGDSLPGVLVPAFLVVFLWFFGISGDSVVGSVARPIWLQYLSDNASAVAVGSPAPHIAPETFFQWFVSIGGSGATIGLVISGFLVGKAKYTKSITRAVAVPALFNISEPIMFGLPVMMNPFFVIPFLLAPLILCLVSWCAFSWGLVSYMAVQPPWTLPAPIGAFLATGGDWRSIVLCLLNILIATVIYYPFMRMYDRSQLKKEELEEPNE